MFLGEGLNLSYQLVAVHFGGNEVDIQARNYIRSQLKGTYQPEKDKGEAASMRLKALEMKFN